MTDAISELVTQVLVERERTRFDAVRCSYFPPPDRYNPIVIVVLKDERLRIVDFLRHYREAGIERFAIVDNGSTDGTWEYLRSQPDVDLYRKDGPFHWIRKQGWINRLIEYYGYRRWYIYADADELIVFDGIEDRSFADLTRKLERDGLRRVRGLLLDMYAAGPLLDAPRRESEPLIDAYPFFDPKGYTERRFKEIISVKGGPRVRVFGRAEPKMRPELTKYPLFSIEANESMINPHHIWPLDDNFVSPRLLALLHFKFLPDLAARIKRAIELKNYWDDSFEYRCYARAIEADPNLSLQDDESAQYRGPRDLASRDLIEPIDWPADSAVVLAARRSFRLRRSAGFADFGAEPRISTDAPPTVAGPRPNPPPTEASPKIELADDQFVGFLP